LSSSETIDALYDTTAKSDGLTYIPRGSMIALLVMPTELSEEEIEGIRRSFKRCREGTADAIIQLRRIHDVSLIPEISRGIVWRYVQADAREVVDKATAETPLASLGIDSLMMLEVVLDVQDALDLVIEDADLRRMQTLGDVNDLLQQRYTEKQKES
jgi:3-hydroxyacyl-[acyl-carrier-protein] dehydratase